MITDQPRTPAGSPTGGQFAGNDRPEADVALAQPPATDTEALRGRVDAVHRRVLARQRAPMGEGDLAEMVDLRLSGLAAGVRATYPAASSFTLEVSEQPGCDDVWYLGTVRDADGHALTDDSYSPDLGDLEDDMHDLGYDMPGHRIEDHPAASDFDGRRGYVTIDIDAALAANAASDDGSGSVELAAARGSALIETYQSQHDDLDAEPETVAADLLGDLHQWARANGVDLDAAFERGRRYADDETAEQTSLSSDDEGPLDV